MNATTLKTMMKNPYVQSFLITVLTIIGGCVAMAILAAIGYFFGGGWAIGVFLFSFAWFLIHQTL